MNSVLTSIHEQLGDHGEKLADHGARIANTEKQGESVAAKLDKLQYWLMGIMATAALGLLGQVLQLVAAAAGKHTP